MGLDFGAIPSNGTSSVGNASAPTINSCGVPDNSSINGLPAVACGSAFDQTLDDFLGYYPGDDANISTVLGIIAPGVPGGSVQRRGFFSSLKSITKVVAPVVKAVAKQVVAKVAPIVAKVIPPVIQRAVVAVAKVVSKVAGAVASKVLSFLTGTFSETLKIPINIAPPAAMLLPSPWGQQFKFYEFVLGSTDAKYHATNAALQVIGSNLIGEPNPVPGIELFCVDCGIVGNIQGIGSVSISATNGFYAGSIGMQGNLEAGLFIGINGFSEWQKQLDISIVKAGLPGFSIPKIVTIGPSLELGISASLTVDAVGQILVGTSYSWPQLSATLDVMDRSKSSRSGFSPIVTRKFEVYGDITATASIGLPVTLAFGLDFFSGEWFLDENGQNKYPLKDVPSINAIAEFSLTGGADTTSGPNGTTFGTPTSINTNGCNGISWQVNVANEVDLDSGDNTEYTLWQWTGPPFAQGCIVRAAASSSSSTTSSSTTTISSSVTTSSTSSTQASLTPSSTILWFSLITPTSTTTSSAQTLQSASSTVLLISLSSTTAAPSTLSIVTGLSTTTTSSASVPATTSGLNPNTPIDCSVDNGKMFTDSQGYVYQVQCHTDHGGDDMASEMASSFQQCIADCFNQQDHDCIGISWVPNCPFVNCYFKGDRNTLPTGTSDSSLGFEVDSAVLISAPPCSSLTCPLNDAQYCMSGGEMFKISCVIAYQTNQLANLNFATLGECVDACSSGWPGVCNGVTFFPAIYRAPTVVGFPESNCYPFEVGNNPVTYGQANGGWSALTRTARNAGYGLWKRETDSFPKLDARQASNATVDNSTTTATLTYVPVFDTTNTLSLNAAADGNLYVGLLNDTTQSTNRTFGFLGETIIGDSQARLLHYYPGSIAAVSASRIRLAEWGSIPETAALITLAPFSAGSTTVFVAVDTLGNYFWLYVCAIQNQQNKVFLANDSNYGESILQDPALKFTVTGGIVNDCAPLALTAGGLQSVS